MKVVSVEWQRNRVLSRMHACIQIIGVKKERERGGRSELNNILSIPCRWTKQGQKKRKKKKEACAVPSHS